MPEWGRVEDDATIALRRRVQQMRNTIEQRRFLRPRAQSRDVDLPLHLRQQSGRGRIGDPCPDIVDVPLRLAGRVDLQGVQVRPHRLRLCGQLQPQEVARRVRGIGRHEERALSPLGAQQRERAGEGGLPDTTLAPEKEHPTVE